MIIDWHTNLHLNEHLSPELLHEMSGRTGPTTQLADAARFEATVGQSAEKFVVITMFFPRLGFKVPNEFVAEFCRKHKGRAVGLACVDPFEPGAVRKLEVAVKELGLRGLKWSPVYGGFHPWCEEAWNIYAKCNELGIPILWHQGGAFAQNAMHEYGSPTLLDRIARTYPTLKMIVAHLAQPWMDECVVLMRKHPSIFADLSARFHRKWQLYNGLMLAREYKVTDRLLFGSDFPLRTTEEAMREFRDINNWGEGVSMPKIPEELIEDIINNRPIELVWKDGI